MNLEHRCPKCGLRAFLPKGNPAKIRCINHPEDLYALVDDYNGADGFYVDEMGNPSSKLGEGPTITPTEGHIADPAVPVRPPEKYKIAEVKDVLEVGTVEQLQAMYFKVAGKRPDGRWRKDSLKTRIKAKVREQAEQRAKEQEAFEKKEQKARAAAQVEAEKKQAEMTEEEERARYEELKAKFQQDKGGVKELAGEQEEQEKVEERAEEQTEAQGKEPQPAS